MTASFVLTLDTTAPQIAWGDATDADAGDLLQVGYTVSEPALQSASLHLRDGRTLDMTDAGSWLQVQLPDDTPEGTSFVFARTQDDVGNSQTFKHAVQLTGVPFTPAVAPVSPDPGVPWPSPPSAPGRPQPAPRLAPEARTVVSASRAATKTDMNVSVRQRRYSARAVARGAGAVSAATRRQSVHRAGTDVQVSVKFVVNSIGRGRGTGSVGRRDGDELEALVALGLI